MQQQPRLISVIIPCRNEERHVSKCLFSVLKHKPVSWEIEILVVDGMSDDNTRAIVSEIMRANPEVRMLDNPKIIQAAGMNIGIKAAKGEIVVRLDAHSEYPETYISDCVGLLLRTGAANAGGRVRTVPGGDGVWGVPFARVTSHPLGVGNAAFRVGGVQKFVDTVPFGTFRRSVFEEIGYFDERLTRNEDNELNERIIKAGYKISFDPSIVITYKNQHTLRGILFHTFNSSKWNIFALCLHPHAWRLRRFVPLIFLLYLLTLMPLAWPAGPQIRFILALPLMAYAILIGGVAFSAKDGFILNLITFFTFFIYHITYGAGMLAGIWSIFSGNWKGDLGQPLR